MSKKKEYKDVKTFTVKRSEWLRGFNINSCLLNEDGKMCCLGFYARACGLRKQDILDMSDPEQCTSVKNKKWNTFLIDDDDGSDDNSQYCWELMEANDDKNLSDKKREKKLTSTFKKAGVKVEFVD